MRELSMPSLFDEAEAVQTTGYSAALELSKPAGTGAKMLFALIFLATPFTPIERTNRLKYAPLHPLQIFWSTSSMDALERKLAAELIQDLRVST